MCLSKTYKIFCIGWLVFACSLSHSQNIKTDVAAINTAYRKLDRLSFTFELNMFESYESQKIYYTQSGRIQKKGHASNQKFDDTECIITPEYSVILDRSEREVVYSPKKMGFNYDDPGLAIDLDSLLRFCKSCQFKRISDKLASYAFRMLPGYPDYSQVIVQFNTENYLVQKIIFYCQEDDISTDNQKERMAKARIEINYKDLNTKPDLSATDFSYEKYLLRNSSEFKLKPELKNYHLTVLSF